MRYYFAPIRTAVIKTNSKQQYWQGCGEIGALRHCRWECKMVQSLWKRVWWFLKRLNIEWSCGSAVPLLGI